MDEIRKTIYAYVPFDIPDGVLSAYFADGVPTDDEKGLNSKLGRLWLWLAMQPTISQGGISITWTEAQKRLFLANARSCFQKADDKEGLGLLPDSMRVRYGYKGSVL